MKTPQCTYSYKTTSDGKILFNVGGSVRSYDITGEKPVLLSKFAGISYPSDIDLSEDESLLAIVNTSGHIAVFESATGKLISKTGGISKEGNNIHFVHGADKVIFSDWGGTAFPLV